MIFWPRKKISARRKHVRDNISAERIVRRSQIANSTLPVALIILTVFIVLTIVLLAIDITALDKFWKPWPEIVALVAVVMLVCAGAAYYIHHYENRIMLKPMRAATLACMFLILLVVTRLGSFFTEWVYLAIGCAVTSAVILTIAYNQRFALGMSLFYSILACFAVGRIATVDLFLTMMAGVMTCCYSLREIRTRMKLIEVSTLASVTVFVAAMALGMIRGELGYMKLLGNAGAAAGVTLVGVLVIQVYLPIIEKVFGIATSMTLLDYSDANQPLLKKLAMEAPGTFSHSLLIGSVAENAAEAIGANGLLCRVGAYYHDVGKINKPTYFIENQMGSISRHDQLSPAMSQLVIVGHVKDGIEIAREFGLPAVLRQFIETHHGTTLVEYFYDRAKKESDEKQSEPPETQFRYSEPSKKPKTKEAAIVMLADGVESATRSLTELTPTKIETLVHNMAMKRLQDGQFDECDLTLSQLSKIETSLAKSLAAHHHGRIAYPKSPDESDEQPVAEGAQASGKA